MAILAETPATYIVMMYIANASSTAHCCTLLPFTSRMLLPLRCDTGSARMMSRTPWCAASQCVTGSQNPYARWKEMSVKSLFRNVVFTVIVSFYSHIEDTNVSFLVRPFSLLGFSSIYCYLLFCFIVFENVQIVQIVQLILWYKSNTSYAEAQVLSIVNGQA